MTSKKYDLSIEFKKIIKITFYFSIGTPTYLIDSNNVTNKNKLWRKIQNQESINGWNWEKVEEKGGGNGKER